MPSSKNLLKDPRTITQIPLLKDFHIIKGVIFELFRVLRDFQIHLSRTFLDLIWSKGSRLKDHNPYYKTNNNFVSKQNFLCSKIVAEKSFTTYLWSEVDHNIVNVCKCQICILRFLVPIVFHHEIYQIWKLYTVMPLLTSWVNQKLSLWTYRTEILCKTSLSDLFLQKMESQKYFSKHPAT